MAHLAHRHVLGQVPLLNAVAQVAACAYGAVTGAFSQLFNGELTLERERAAKDHSLYLIASVRLPVGHVAIAGEAADGSLSMLGFGPDELSYEVVLGDSAGKIEDDDKLFKAARI